VHHEQPDVHVSGHACQEELKLMINITRPKFFIPMHGTLRHLIHHARLAEETGVPHGIVITNGQVAEISATRCACSKSACRRAKCSSTEAEEVPDVVVRDRQHLAEDGFVIVVVAVDSDGRLIREPELITRGLVHVDASQEVLERGAQMLVGMFTESPPDELRDSDMLQERMRALLKRYFRKSMGRRPMILPVIWEM
jgi:ribonuclease J